MSEYYFTVDSDEYGTEEYGPYDTEEEAYAAQERVVAAARGLKDEIQRTFSVLYQKNDEDEGTDPVEHRQIADCGCTHSPCPCESADCPYYGASCNLCPVHAAAPGLLAALEREHEAAWCETNVTGQPCGTCTLIAAAKGGAK